MKEFPAVRHVSSDRELTLILELIRNSFSYMDSRINPPSSMHRLTLADIAAKCETGEVWSMGNPVRACVMMTLKEDSLYLSKLAVAETARRTGYARHLVHLAEWRAIVLGKPYLELQTRIELTENHVAFTKLGFEKIGEGSHEGYEKPTYLCMRKSVSISDEDVIVLR